MVDNRRFELVVASPVDVGLCPQAYGALLVFEPLLVA